MGSGAEPKWPKERVRELQNRRFLEVMQVGWRNPFYRKRWQAVGLSPGDIKSLDDIVKLPTMNSEDIKQDQIPCSEPQSDHLVKGERQATSSW